MEGHTNIQYITVLISSILSLHHVKTCTHFKNLHFYVFIEFCISHWCYLLSKWILYSFSLYLQLNKEMSCFAEVIYIYIYNQSMIINRYEAYIYLIKLNYSSIFLCFYYYLVMLLFIFHHKLAL